jgi:hypothetical protein
MGKGQMGEKIWQGTSIFSLTGGAQYGLRKMN